MSETRIPIALVTNTLPPYRKHVHLRVARELPQLRVWTLTTHAQDDRWLAPMPGEADELGLISLDNGVSVWKQGRPQQWGREWEVGGRLIAWIRREKVRAVVLSGYNDLARLRLLSWCKLHGLPVLIWGDSNIQDDVESLKNRPLKALAKKIYLGIVLKLCSGALTAGAAGKAYFEKYGVRSDRIFLFPLEIDYRAIRALSNQTIAMARRQYGLAVTRRRLLFCGRIVPEKRADLLLDAFAAIAEKRPLWDLVVLGDGRLRADLQSHVPFHLRQRIIWLGNISDVEMVHGIQRCCDVLVMPSDVEPWGLVVNEALAAGLAVICSSVVGAAVDLVRDGVNGRVFPTGDRPALEACLLDVTDENGRLASMREHSVDILANWIRRADPVKGLCQALEKIGVLASTNAVPSFRPELHSHDA